MALALRESLPHSMRAVNVRSPGGADQLELVDLPLPLLEQNDVLIRVIAAGVNRPDVLQRKGLYPAPADASPILGLEVCGTVVQLGEGANPT